MSVLLYSLRYVLVGGLSIWMVLVAYNDTAISKRSFADSPTPGLVAVVLSVKDVDASK